MAEFIEFLSPQALAELEKANAELLTMVANVNKVGQATKNITTPSAGKGAIQDLTEQYKKQEQTIASLQKQLTELAKARTANKQKTAEEIAGARILASNANQQAMATIGLAGAYRNLSAQQAIAARKVQDLISSGKKADQTQRQYNQELRKAQREFDELNERVLKADNAVGKFNRNVGNYPRAAFSFAKDLIGAFGIVAGVGAIAEVTNNIYENIKAQQSLDLALKSVTATSAEYARAQEFINELAQKQGLEINNLQEQYTAFYVAASGKLSDADLEQVFGDIARSGAALGLTNEALERSFNAVNQMLSKGTVASEELRGQLAESLPGAVQAMTRAVQILHPELKNLTEKDLFNLIKEGRILASEVLPETAKQLALLTGAENAQNVDTLTKSVNRLSNEWKNFIRELNDGDGVFAGVISRTTNGMANIVKYSTNAIKSAAELRKEELNSYRTDLYTQELDALQALGKEAKAQASIRKPIIEAQLADENKLVEILNARLKTQEVGGAAYLQTLKELKAANNDAYGSAGQLDAVNKVLKDIGVNTKANTELTEKQKKALELENKNRFELNISNLEREKFLLQQRLKQDEVYGQEKVDLENKIAGFEIAILSEKFREALRLSKGNVDAQKKLANEYITDIEKIGGFKSIFQKPEIATDSENPETPLIDEKDATDSMDWLKQYREELKLTEEETQRLKDATDEFVKSFTQGFFDNAGLSTLFEVLDGRLDEFGDNWKAKTLLISEAMQEMYNFIAELSQANFDREREQLKQETEIALAFAGDSDTARAEIERQAEQRRKEIARREFKAKKEQAKVNIIIDTAQAVVAALPKIPLSILIGALGAAQLAVVSSQQAPAYKDGTQNHKGGLMLVNDGNGSNFAETIQTPDGSIYKPKERNVFMNAPKGTKVFTHDQWQKNLDSILMSNEINYAQPNVVVNSGMSDAQVDRIVSSINNKSEAHLNIDKNGFNVKIRNGHTTKEILNNQVTFGR